jgi:hypothetical protein
MDIRKSINHSFSGVKQFYIFLDSLKTDKNKGVGAQFGAQ